MYINLCCNILCRQYKVIAVPVSKDADQPRSMPYKPVVPLPQLMSHALSKKLATQVTEHVPFIVGDYAAKELPHSLTFNGKWVRQAFKPDTYYSVVVVAFGKTEVSTASVCSLISLMVSCLSLHRVMLSHCTV